MDSDKTAGRQRVRELAQQILPSGDFAGFFDAVYAGADGDSNGVPWADLEPHPLALEWLRQHDVQGQGKRALVVGCGLGDDAEELAKRGFQVTAFDVSPNAIAWAQRRFPDLSVSYQTANLLEAPAAWEQTFGLVLEIYTIQALLVKLRTQAIESIARFIAPGGQLLIICRGRDNDEELGTMPWPLSRADLAQFEQAGLHEASFEDIRVEDQRHFRIVYER